MTFIALLAIVSNSAIFQSLTLGRAIGGLAFNLFILSLVVIWWASYFSNIQAKARLLVIGHATLLLAAGIGITLNGANVVFTKSCESLVFGNKPNGPFNQFVTHLQSNGYCRELGVAVTLFGLLTAYPSIRLFLGITRRFSKPPSAYG